MQIHLADLRHSTVGKHSSYMPIAIGYIASYSQSCFGSDVSFKLHTEVETIISDLQHSDVDILGISNYCWNAEISRFVGRYAKKNRPDTVIVAGGPEFPTDSEEIVAYLKYRNEVDFYVYNYEGEVAFSELLKRIQGNESIQSIKLNPPPGIACLNTDREVVKGPVPERLEDLDLIPSPILSGMMDDFLLGNYMPFLETTRGCPYGCTFCVQSDEWYNKIYGFSSERIQAELVYITERIKDFPDIPLALSDSNFGMYPRDLETAKFLAQLSKHNGWPNSYIIDTGKSQPDRLIEVALTLNRRISMSLSPQSLNEVTLKEISRTNLGGKKNRSAVYEKFKANGIVSNAAIILPLPEETKTSFITGLRVLSESHVEQPLAYTTMLLKGTPLASPESRKRHKMKTKYRLLPRQFGEYLGERVVEYDEVCVATKTLNYEDYLECRGLSLIFLALSSQQYNFLYPVCEELGVDWFDLLLEIWEVIKKKQGGIGDLYKEFIEASEGELFNSTKDLFEFVHEDKNYQRLLKGEIGETIMRNFVPRMIINYFDETTDLAISLLKKTKTDADWLSDLKIWAEATRNILPTLDVEKRNTKDSTIRLNMDIDRWVSADGKEPIDNFISTVEYRLVADQEGIDRAVDAMIKLYGKDRLRWISRLLETKPLEEIWRKCVVLDQVA